MEDEVTEVLETRLPTGFKDISKTLLLTLNELEYYAGFVAEERHYLTLLKDHSGHCSEKSLKE